jgi:hypothetical protein
MQPSGTIGGVIRQFSVARCQVSPILCRIGELSISLEAGVTFRVSSKFVDVG